MHLREVIADHFVHKITLDGPIVSTCTGRDLSFRIDNRCFGTSLFFKLLDFKFFQLDDFLHLVEFIFAFADAAF